MHINFAEDQMILKVLKFYCLNRCLNCIPLSFLSMTQVKSHKNFHSEYENIMVYVKFIV